MRHKLLRWAPWSFVALMALAIIGLASVVAISILVIWPGLPPLDVITDYQPRVPLRVYTADGYLIKEIGEERRAVVKIENVPAFLKQALISAEDEHFYEHPGVDMKGLLRAALSNLRSGGRGQGASTITMQVARNFFLSPEKSMTRKWYEILLARKIEQNLTKDQILELYINQIYLGQRAYGFEVAAQTYFGKSLPELSLGEIAILAALPKAPSTINPIVNPVRAQNRQRYVLGRMLSIGYIDQAQYRQAVDEPIKTTGGSAARDPSILSPVHAEYVAEIARQIAVSQFGEQATQRGIKVVTTITRAEQEAAYEALRQGVMDYDHRHGYRGPEKYITLPDGDLEGKTLDDAFDTVISDKAPKGPKEQDDKLRDYGDLLVALVINASPREVTVYRNGQTIKIGASGLGFAAPMLGANAPQTRRVRRGALVRIRNAGGNKGWELTQVPEVDAALVSLDPQTGAVRALVGGFDFDRNQFNNVTQARRQPGSSFKPFIYSASLERGYAPGTLLLDEPLDYPAGVTGRAAWVPHNYDDKFAGPMTMREALERSKNIPIIRVLEDITPAYAQSYIANFGFDAARHPPYLTMALGAGAASPWEMATGYAVFANGGYRVHPHIVKEITDVKGETRASFNQSVAGESALRVIDARNAWIMNSMLQDVVRKGTAKRALVLKRGDLAGKTGTTNEFGDAWFCGYTPTLVSVVWLGFPTPRNMGRGETGGTAALPLWVNYMRSALAGVPETTLPRPDGIASAPAGDGSDDDYYYAEFQPPELLQPKSVVGVGDSNMLDNLFNAPASTPFPAPPPGGNAPVDDPGEQGY